MDNQNASIEIPAAAETLLALMHAQAEVARLSEREQLFSSLLVSVNAVLWAFDWQTQRMIYVSPAYERIFGRSAGLLLADFGEWRDSIYPDDLDYAEDSNAGADANFVLAGNGGIVEVQATAEDVPFDRAAYDQMFALAEKGCKELFAKQREALGL